MGNNNSDNSTTFDKAKTTKRVFRAIPLIITLILVIIALLSLSSFFTLQTDVVMTFWGSFLIGLSGAGVYLMLLLLVEGDLKILENKTLPDLGTMTFLFLLSGGFVAAVTQITTGVLGTSGVWAVFLIGFGWQGAISGVAGAPVRVRLSKDLADCGKNSNELARTRADVERRLKECGEKREALQAELIELKTAEKVKNPK